jgi:thiol-disulfide isomerase/thioredoxin
MKSLLLIVAATALCFAQADTDPEQEALRRAIAEGSTSNVDLIRVLEAHLAKFPNSTRRFEIERALTKAAIEAKDDARIAQYGERVLAREPDDLATLERVARALLGRGDPESTRRALGYARKYEAHIRDIASKPAGSGAEMAKRKEDIDRALGRALLSQAIATGNLGDAAAAVALARKSFEANPSVEAAAELGRRYQQSGKPDDAIRAFADAFTIPDTAVSDADRALIRRRLGEIYQKAKGSETGLGDLVLQAYDRNTALLADRRLALRQFDPNLGFTNPMDFVLSGLRGDKLAMASLLGKAVVFDFWATWCGPCRAQHPLYAQVKKRFAADPDVVFLAINTDEDRSVVKPFLADLGWDDKVYFEDGLSRTLRVNSIPTTIVIGRDGTIVSRMNGFDPERFVDMLTDRIREALRRPAK